MSMNEKDIELIDKAIRDELSVSDKVLFENRMKDATFNVEWKNRQVIQSVIEEKSRAHLKSDLIDMENKVVRPSASPRSLWLWLSLLAFLIIAALTFYYFTHSNSETDTNTQQPARDSDKKPVEVANPLYAAYYQPYPNDYDPITKSADDKKSLSAYQLYEQGQYDEAISAFIPKIKDDDARWYFAHAMLANNDDQMAKDIFLSFSKKSNSPYRQHAQWYLALVHIKNNNSKLAEPLLTQLVESNHRIYVSKARELLDKIN